MKSCLIIGAAPCADPSYLVELKDLVDMVICADGGIDHAHRAGIHPDVWIGDCDSAKKTSDHLVLLPKEKDDTDLYCAAKYACNNGCDTVLIAAATGGRGDHFLANLYLLEALSEQKISAEIIDEQNRFFMHSGGEMKLCRDTRYQYVSILPLDAELSDVTLVGLKYPLENAVIKRSHIISVSNEPILDEFSIAIGSGKALIVLSRDVNS